MTKNTSLLGKDYWKNFFKLLLQVLLTAIVGGIVALAVDSEILFIIILALGILYFGRSFYLKNRLYQMDVFKNKLLETGEYELERLNSMSYMELNLRQAFHKVVPNASNLSYEEFKALTKTKSKEAVVALAQATGAVAGAIGAAASQTIASTDWDAGKSRYTCRNCGRMGTIGSPCSSGVKGAFCVAVEVKDSLKQKYTCRNCGRIGTLHSPCPATNGGFCTPVGNS